MLNKNIRDDLFDYGIILIVAAGRLAFCMILVVLYEWMKGIL